MARHTALTWHNGKKILKKAAVASAGTLAAVSVLTAGIFSSPRETVAIPETPPAIVEVYKAEEAAPVQSKKKNLRERLQALLLRLPLAVRAALLLPLWSIGTAISFLARKLLPKLLLWITGTIWPLLLALLGLKLLFPQVSLKKLFSKRNRPVWLAAALLLLLAGPACDWLFPDTAWAAVLLKTGIALILFLAAALQLHGIERKFN